MADMAYAAVVLCCVVSEESISLYRVSWQVFSCLGHPGIVGKNNRVTHMMRDGKLTMFGNVIGDVFFWIKSIWTHTFLHLQNKLDAGKFSGGDS